MRLLKRKVIWLSFICFVFLCLFIEHSGNFISEKKVPYYTNSMIDIPFNIKDIIISDHNAVQSDNAIGDNTGITYIDAKPFLLSTSDTDEILKAKPLQFLTDVKNPCFALTDNYVNVGNITMSYALKKGYEIRCMPYVFQAGFTKCGTDDIFKKISVHKLLSGNCKKIPYRTYQQDPSPVDCEGKEWHWWDNMYFVPNHTMNKYTQSFLVNNIANSYQQRRSEQDVHNLGYDFSNMIYIDATPRLIWHGDNWDEYVSNQGLLSPDVIIPRLIHHVIPNSKFIITMRNPTSRLFSDYRYYYRHDDATPHDFHRKVVDAIAWWEKCVMHYPIRACAYGKAPPGMAELGFERCVRNKSFTIEMRQSDRGVCQSSFAWTLNSADRLRVSMYDIFIAEWLKLFPKENFLFLKLEEYSSDPLTYVQTHVLPFLGLPPFREDEKDILGELMLKIKNKSKIVMEMMAETKEILDQFYKRTQDNLYDILHDDRFLWIK